MIDKFWTRLKSYFKPTSLTWWAGVAMIVSGVVRYNEMHLGTVTSIVRPLLMAIEPGNSLMMILAGFGFVGLRGALDRQK